MHTARRVLLFLFVFISMTALVSCSKITSANIPLGEDELPDMIMHEATYVYGDSGRKPLIMNANTITVYSGKNGRTLMDSVSFVQKAQDENGQDYIEMEGHCDSVFISSDNSVAKMNGNVKLTKKTDDFSIECDSLEWNDEKQTINSDSMVSVNYEDGTELKAIGFSAQLNDNIYEFGQIVEGRYTNEK